MSASTLNPILLRKKLTEFLEEDLVNVPYHTASTGERTTCVIEAQERLLVCGTTMLGELFALATPAGWTPPFIGSYAEEGKWVEAGTAVFYAQMHPEVLKHAIRTALNLLQHLCGISTRTAELVAQLKGAKCTLLDTRKTTPGLRALEKHAVRVGGAKNHRVTRADGIMLKKEDIALAHGDIPRAISEALRHAPHLTAVEVEAEDIPQLLAVMNDGRVRHVLLDNMSPEDVQRAVSLAGHKLVLEASGVDVARLAEYAATGVPFISTSAMVGTARKMRLHLQVERPAKLAAVLAPVVAQSVIKTEGTY